MKKIALIVILSISAVFIAYSLSEYYSSERISVSDQFVEYWYNGQGELNSYSLTQARYGKHHTGEAVLVFVAEDFSESKQVKVDDPSSSSDKIRKVLKMNFTKKFITGIYPYSMMLSVFTPIDENIKNPSLKVVASSQEWCGQTFSQLNLRNEAYQLNSYSYFESEGDVETELPVVLLEDEIWNLIRINPALIPEGKIEIIPGFFSSRLRHIPVKKQPAIIDKSEGKEPNTWLMENGWGPGMNFLTITYLKDNRTLVIFYDPVFPYRIYGWDESYVEGFGRSTDTIHTSALLKSTLRLDYWNHHNPPDSIYRDSLKL